MERTWRAAVACVVAMATLGSCSAETISDGAPASTSAPSTTPASTTAPVWTLDPAETCAQPYPPIAYRTQAPSQTEVLSSGPVETLTGTEATLYPSVDSYPGEPPPPPPGLVLPADGIRGVIASNSAYGVFSGLLDPEAGTIWLVNGETSLVFAGPPGSSVHPTRFVTTADGAAYMEMSTNDRSGQQFYRWRIDRPCASAAP